MQFHIAPVLPDTVHFHRGGCGISSITQLPMNVITMHYSKDWEATREAIRIRDRDKCQNCGASGDGVTLDIHHVVPRGQGGSDRMSNLVLLCRRCHDAAHEKQIAPTVDFRSSGSMRDGEFSLYRRFFEEVPSARYDPGEKVWRVPVADMEQLVESIEELPSSLMREDG